ncbi:yippee-domain-containing protein [Acephala macrosclerotiorum]|nr:yippee-domain-containing protein [Acephala macrosclerotiorum]
MASETRPPFPTYLIPTFNFPFRRQSQDAQPQRERQQSTSSTASDKTPSLSYSPASSAPTSPASSTSLTRLHRAQPNTLRCSTCATDIALSSQIVSKGFTGRHGRAYLVSAPLSLSQASYPPPRLDSKNKDHEWRPYELINTRTGRSVNRELLTGMHVVADVSCNICGVTLGWKYVDAKEQSQKYKVGKFILEMKRVVLRSGWEDVVDDEIDEDEAIREYLAEEGEGEEDGPVVFDSEDEDECEDLFAGVWDPEVVRKRRSRTVGGWKRRGD